MRHHASVRVRGIYTTALTALVLKQGYTIVDASPVIQERLGIPQREEPEDVRIFDRRDRQGVVVEGTQESATEVVRQLQKTLPHALFSPFTREASFPQQEDGGRLDARRTLRLRSLAEFPATVKVQLDQVRSLTVPRSAPVMADRCVILVDDGLATGATMRAAVAAVHQQQSARVVVAVPVAPPATIALLRQEVDEVICPAMPEPFFGIGQWYEDFSQVTDEEVRALLAQAWRRQPAYSESSQG